MSETVEFDVKLFWLGIFIGEICNGFIEFVLSLNAGCFSGKCDLLFILDDHVV